MLKKSYLEPVRATLDALMDYGTDRYGIVHSPIWMSILDAETLDSPRHPLPLDEDVRVQRRGRRAPGGSNLFLDQSMLRAARLLGVLTQDESYEEAARSYASYYLKHFTDSQTGLIEWGPHNFVNAYDDAVQYLEGHYHEIHAWMPFWPFLHASDAAATEREIEQIWHWHFDHQTAQFGRHPERGAGCSFAMTGGEFIAAFAYLYWETGRPELLERALRAARVHWNARNRESNLAPNQAEPEEWDLTRFDAITTDTSISGLWCSRLLAASALTNNSELREMAVAELTAFLKYQWAGVERPWGQLNLNGSPVRGPRAPIPEGVPNHRIPYECWAPRGELDLWPAYMLGYEYPQETALTYVFAHRVTREPQMLEGALRWARVYSGEIEKLKERGGTYAQHYGMIVSFFVELANETGDQTHLSTAKRYADQAIELLFNGKILRGHPAKPYYEAADGVGFLCYGLLQLQAAAPPSLNPFDWNL